LKEKQILCLAQDRRNPKILYAGTTNGIFRYEEEMTDVWRDKNASRQMMPQNFKLYPAYPNPFNSSTVIRFELIKSDRVSLKIYNLMGQEVCSLYEGIQSAGNHIITWDGTDNANLSVASGIYLCSLSVDQRGGKVLKKLIFIK